MKNHTAHTKPPSEEETKTAQETSFSLTQFYSTAKKELVASLEGGMNSLIQHLTTPRGRKKEDK